ncbi:hypothetical protein MHU86_18045 [Fragilaria crotonensis]|nr:hypothetical protein MHU86_18045 [Fragilaria crotonensis]
MTLEEVDGTECKRNIINDAVAFSLQNGHPPVSRHHLSDKSNQPTDASHVEFYTYPPEDLDFLLTEHMESQFDLVQNLFDHNEQDQGSAFHGGLSSDSHHQMSDNANQPIEATHTEFYPYPPEDLDFLLIEQMQSQDDHVQSLFAHNEQDEENTNQTGLSCGSRDHMPDDALEPTYGCCIAPYPIGLPTNQQLRFSLEDLDHLKTVLVEQTKSQDDRIHILSDREEQGLEIKSLVGLPPDRQMDSHTIDASSQCNVWFKCSKINSEDSPKDARSERPKWQHFAFGSLFHPFMQALGLLLVQAFLQSAEITGWDPVQTMCVQSKVLQMSQGPRSVLGSFHDNRFESDECGAQDRLSFNHVNSRAHWFLTSLMKTFIRVGCPTQ